MKRILTPAILLLGISSFYSQEIISSAGQVFSSNGVNLSWTIGEPMTSTVDNGNTILTQGYQQANLIISSLDEKRLNTYHVFPNPTHNKFTIQTYSSLGTLLVGNLYNIEGKLIKEIEISGLSTVVHLDQIPLGMYLLKISEGNENNIYRIIKN